MVEKNDAPAYCANCGQPIEKVGDEWHPYSALAKGCAPQPCTPGGVKPNRKKDR